MRAGAGRLWGLTPPRPVLLRTGPTLEKPGAAWHRAPVPSGHPGLGPVSATFCVSGMRTLWQRASAFLGGCGCSKPGGPYSATPTVLWGALEIPRSRLHPTASAYNVGVVGASVEGPEEPTGVGPRGMPGAPGVDAHWACPEGVILGTAGPCFER